MQADNGFTRNKFKKRTEFTVDFMGTFWLFFNISEKTFIIAFQTFNIP